MMKINSEQDMKSVLDELVLGKYEFIAIEVQLDKYSELRILRAKDFMRISNGFEKLCGACVTVLAMFDDCPIWE